MTTKGRAAPLGMTSFKKTAANIMTKNADSWDKIDTSAKGMPRRA